MPIIPAISSCETTRYLPPIAALPFGPSPDLIEWCVSKKKKLAAAGPDGVDGKTSWPCVTAGWAPFFPGIAFRPSWSGQ